MRFVNDNGALVCYHNGEMVRIEAWGEDSLRVRAVMGSSFKCTSLRLSSFRMCHNSLIFNLLVL